MKATAIGMGRSVDGVGFNVPLLEAAVGANTPVVVRFGRVGGVELASKNVLLDWLLFVEDIGKVGDVGKRTPVEGVA